MDVKLRQILELALRPETGDGESSAALAAARRLVAKHGMELLSAEGPERVVYRDRVVYRKPNHSHSLELKLMIPATFHHAMMERIFLDAASLGCAIELISCGTQTEAILSGTVIKFKVMGTKAAVDAYNRTLDGYVDQMNRKQGRTPHSQDTTHRGRDTVHPKPKSKGWFSKLFGG